MPSSSTSVPPGNAVASASSQSSDVVDRPGLAGTVEAGPDHHEAASEAVAVRVQVAVVHAVAVLVDPVARDLGRARSDGGVAVVAVEAVGDPVSVEVPRLGPEAAEGADVRRRAVDVRDPGGTGVDQRACDVGLEVVVGAVAVLAVVPEATGRCR